ncbi:MAG: thioredoxin family protein [Bacteroidales bacterium]|jgi:thioredoxin|nr:thioredoxin family protein [Bacteroidales bacterium]
MNKKITFIAVFLMFFAFFGCNNRTSSNDTQQNSTDNDKISSFSIDENNMTQIPEEDLSGEVILITEEDFSLRISDFDDDDSFRYKGKTPCIVDFFAGWCAPCHRLHPVLVELAKEYKGKIIFYQVDVDREPNLSQTFNVQYLPTLLFMKEDSAPTIFEGAPSKEELIDAINKVFFTEK